MTDGRIQKGNETRKLVLERTVQIASAEGLGGLSLGRLATELSISKSGVFALFGSKEELQLATVRAARRIFVQQVVEPALQAPQGLARVLRLCGNWLEYSRTRVFSGGCFFYSVSAEFDAQAGRVRDEIARSGSAWEQVVVDMLESARVLGELRDDIDVRQVGFELISFMESANANSVLHDDEVPYARATRAIRLRLAEAAAEGVSLPGRD